MSDTYLYPWIVKRWGADAYQDAVERLLRYEARHGEAHPDPERYLASTARKRAGREWQRQGRERSVETLPVTVTPASQLVRLVARQELERHSALVADELGVTPVSKFQRYRLRRKNNA